MDMVLLAVTTLSLAAAAGFGALSWRVGLEERERSRARITALSAAMDADTSPATGHGRIAVGSVFDGVRGSLAGRPVVRFTAIGAVVTVIAIAATLAMRTGAQTGRAVAAPAPLELMSMRYQHQGTTLTVSGLVRNPSDGTPMEGVTAVVFAFDRNGSFVTSGRAPVDFNALAAGDESPFVVSMSNVTDVARYRVSFRTATGVVRHVDKRSTVLAQAMR